MTFVETMFDLKLYPTYPTRAWSQRDDSVVAQGQHPDLAFTPLDVNHADAGGPVPEPFPELVLALWMYSRSGWWENLQEPPVIGGWNMLKQGFPRDFPTNQPSECMLIECLHHLEESLPFASFRALHSPRVNALCVAAREGSHMLDFSHLSTARETVSMSVFAVSTAAALLWWQALATVAITGSFWVKHRCQGAHRSTTDMAPLAIGVSPNGWSHRCTNFELGFRTAQLAMLVVLTHN